MNNHLCATLYAAALLASAPALAQDGVPNAFVATYGPDVQVREVSVTVRDNIFAKPQDAAARNYLHKRMPADQKAAFQAVAPDATGERMAEFLASQILAKRLREGDGTPATRVLVEVTGFKMRSSFPLPGSEPLPIGDAKVSFAFRVQDAATGRDLAQAVVEDCVVATADMDEAKTLAGLNYAPLGKDIQFRMVAASMNAVARYVEAVLEQPTLPTGTVTANSFALANGALIKDQLRHPQIRLTVQPRM